MNSIGRTIGKKATQATFRHSLHGVVSKAKRQPLRTSTLLSAGGMIGATAGFLAGRKSAGGSSS